VDFDGRETVVVEDLFSLLLHLHLVSKTEWSHDDVLSCEKEERKGVLSKKSLDRELRETYHFF